MKAMKLTGLRGMEMQEVAKPEIQNHNDVLIRMERVGICGSDVHYFSEGGIGSQRVVPPWTVGHEGAGVVEAIGSSVTRVKVGDRIAFDPALPCWECDQCLQGRPHTCRNQRFLGCPGQIEGCLAQWLVMPERSCYPIPDLMTFDEAAMVEPLTIALYGLQLSVPMQGAKIGILGAGPIGLCVLLPARAQGAQKIYVTDKIEARLELARRAGADWAGHPNEDAVAKISAQEPELLDAVFECSGEQEAMDQGIELLKPGGKLMLIGIPGASNRVSFDINLLRRKEICIQNVRRQNNCVQDAIDLIASKQFDINILKTHEVPFAQTPDAFAMVADYRDGVVKVMVQFD